MARPRIKYSAAQTKPDSKGRTRNRPNAKEINKSDYLEKKNEKLLDDMQYIKAIVDKWLLASE